jgi:hypothetical protein
VSLRRGCRFRFRWQPSGVSRSAAAQRLEEPRPAPRVSHRRWSHRRRPERGVHASKQPAEWANTKHRRPIVGPVSRVLAPANPICFSPVKRSRCSTTARLSEAASPEPRQANVLASAVANYKDVAQHRKTDRPVLLLSVSVIGSECERIIGTRQQLMVAWSMAIVASGPIQIIPRYFKAYLWCRQRTPKTPPPMPGTINADRPPRHNGLDTPNRGSRPAAAREDAPQLVVRR